MTSEPVKVRLVSLPILELVPVFVAQQEGLFKKHGIEFELISVSSGAEKESILAVGEAEGGIGELLSTMLANQDGVRLQLVTGSYLPSEEHPVFSIIAAENSGIESVEDLKGVEIAASEGTPAHYVLDRVLQKSGLSNEDIKYIYVPRIPERLTLLNEGKIQAASLPTHLGLMAVQDGAKIIADDGKYPELMSGGWVFRKEFIDEHPETVNGFLAALEEAVEIVNADPQKYKPIAIDNNLIPKPIAETYIMPTFPLPYLPSVEQFEDVYNWALEKGLIEREDLAYEDMLYPELLP
jgi:NitT/TauT family transport system substrate-binding protein